MRQASSAASDVDKLTRDEQMAFWLNAYNALVLQTVVDHYPLRGRSTEYPRSSIRADRRAPSSDCRIASRAGR